MFDYSKTDYNTPNGFWQYWLELLHLNGPAVPQSPHLTVIESGCRSFLQFGRGLGWKLRLLWGRTYRATERTSARLLRLLWGRTYRATERTSARLLRLVLRLRPSQTNLGLLGCLSGLR